MFFSATVSFEASALPGVTGFVEAMISKLSYQYHVDKKRIYAAGYSNGGRMAYGLAISLTRLLEVSKLNTEIEKQAGCM